MVRTSGFHPDNSGSIPLGDATVRSENRSFWKLWFYAVSSFLFFKFLFFKFLLVFFLQSWYNLFINFFRRLKNG